MACILVFALSVQHNYLSVEAAARFKDPNVSPPFEPLLSIWRPLSGIVIVWLPFCALAASLAMPTLGISAVVATRLLLPWLASLFFQVSLCVLHMHTRAHVHTRIYICAR